MKKLIVAAVLLLGTVSAFAAEEARLLRFPSVGGDKVVFTYAGDLYVTSINGGEAARLTSNIGFETFSRISPDGKTIAFTGQYDGNTEVYTMPIEGGHPKRITYSATLSRDNIGDRMGPNNIVMCWTPDGKSIVYRSRWYAHSGMRGLLYKVSPNGGVPEQIPVTEGGFCSYSPDGKYFAFNRMCREFRTWKYYKGGQADEIWINKVGTNSLETITSNSNQDIFPMWIGDEIFYLSDRDRTMNLFVYNTKTKATDKVTNFTEYDCKFPSFSKDYVVFENGGYIYKFDVKSRKLDKLTIYLKEDGLYSRAEMMTVSPRSFSISPDGERILAVARGDVFSLPASKGATYNITRSSGANDRNAVWSPDGKTIAYFSDRSGEYQVYTAPAENMDEAVCRTSFVDGYPDRLTWSPDSKTLYFITEKNQLYALNAASGDLKCLLTGRHGGIRRFDISPDSKWIVFTEADDNTVSVIYLYENATGKVYPVTDKWYDSGSPLFSLDGKYLFFTSARKFSSQYSGVEWNANMRMENYAFVLPLSKDTPDPTTIVGDEYKAVPQADQASPAKGAPEKKDGKDAPAKPAAKKDVVVKIDTDRLPERASMLPLGSGNVNFVYAPEGKLYYMASGGQGAPGAQGSRGGMKVLDLKTMKSNDAPFKGNIVCISAKGKALVREGRDMKVISLAGGPSRGDVVPTDGLKMLVDHAQEWNQIYNESWRITRDGFYVKNMHGRDWQAVHDKYAAMLPYVRHRHDLTYLIGEMLGELNVGHAYITSGEAPEAPRVKVGLLGGQFSKAKDGSFRIEKIFEGENWSESTRSPLTEAGINVSVGDFITAIDGIEAKQYSDIYEALVGKAQEIVALKVADKNGKNQRTVYVKTIADETQLAYIEWVKGNIAKVDKATGGKVGYIHLPDMGAPGLEMFTKLYYTQLDKKALIIDDRMNGGGNISPIVLERLLRVPYRMSMRRNGEVEPVPNQTHYGPKVVLIDKYSMSDGDLFPYSFKKMGLGTVIGMRSWGGIVGISGSKPFLDGQDMRTPFFTSYSVDKSEWIVEGYGVDPDIVVDINPFDDFNGKDAQLDKAIEVVLGQLKDYKELPPVPADPVR